LGAKNAFFFVDKPGGMVHTDCCMWSTVGDMVRVGEMLMNKGLFQDKEILPPGWVNQMIEPSNANINYGMQIWLGNKFEAKRPYDSRLEAFANLHSEPFKADDVFFMDGLGKQRIYMIPSQSLVILRTGSQDSEWDDSKLPNLILEALQ
jgi:CubicO group peptidase (beta-lactamase class C family)